MSPMRYLEEFEVIKMRFPSLVTEIVDGGFSDLPSLTVSRKVRRGDPGHSVVVIVSNTRSTPRWEVQIGTGSEIFWTEGEAIDYVVNSFIEYSN